MCVQRNNEGRSRNRCCDGKAIIVTYSEWVFVALGIHHSTRMRRILFVACGLSGHVIFLHMIPKNVTIFRDKLWNIKCVLISCTIFVCYVLILKRIGWDPIINPLNAELNPIYHLLALLGAHHIFNVGGLRVNVYRSSSKVPVILVRF
jgi:hypothetical protein